MSKKCFFISLVSISFLFLILSIGSLLIFTNIDYFINQQIKAQAPLVNGSKPLEKWSHPANDTKFKYTLYLFNVTNANNIQEGQNPIVKEVGPYEFILKKKWNLHNWENNGSELNFDMMRTFYRDETCKGNLDDKVTILNVPLMSFASLLKDKTENFKFKKQVEGVLKRMLRKRQLFVTQKAGDLLWNGYRDEFTTKVAFLIKMVKRLGIHLDVPSSIADDGTFSLLGQKNNSNFGIWSIDTGLNNLTELGRVKKVDLKSVNISCWQGSCSSIHGTDGLIHHPFIKNDDILPVFEPELNRTVFLDYERESEYMGIPTKRFVLSNLTYSSPTTNPYNKCFCPDQTDEFNMYNGILKVKHCYQEVPVVFSQPHFYQADNYFRKEIDGLKPNKTKHESFADISKELGLVLNGRKTIQLNLDTNAYFYFTNEKRKIFPVFWLADSGCAGPSSINELSVELYDKVEMIKKYLIIGTSIFFAGFLVPIIYLVIDLAMYWSLQDDETQQIIDRSDNLSNGSSVQSKRANEVIEDHLNVVDV